MLFHGFLWWIKHLTFQANNFGVVDLESGQNTNIWTGDSV